MFTSFVTDDVYFGPMDHHHALKYMILKNASETAHRNFLFKIVYCTAC
jgi:hypothetical protein